MVFPWRLKYRPIPELEESLLHSELFPPHARASRIRGLVSHTLTFLVAAFLSITVLAIFQPASESSPNKLVLQTKYLHCGNSTTEARSLGCVYDALSNMWVPEPCYDAEGVEEFMQRAPWQGYDTPEAKHQLTLEEMSERTEGNPYWTPLREHSIHCALMWERMHRDIIKTGNTKIMDNHLASYHHTVHCANSLIKTFDERPEDMDEVVIHTWVGFSQCEIDI